MNLSWKLLPLAAIAAFGFLALVPGGGAKPQPAQAWECTEETVEIQVNILDLDDGSQRIEATGSEVRISPDPTDAGGTRTYVDNGDYDDNLSIGRIEEDDACYGDNPGNEYVFTLLSLPGSLDCDIVDDTFTVDAEVEVGIVVNFEVENCVAISPTATGTPGTATPTVTGTPTGDTVTLLAVPANPPCGSPSFIFATVRNNQNVPLTGQTVTFSASGSLGSFNPASGMTGGDGVFSTTYTPPATGAQAITITGTVNGKTGTATVTTACAAAVATATSTPVPPTSPIKPPSTGDAGLISQHGTTLYAGLALFIATLFLGTMVVARRRA